MLSQCQKIFKNKYSSSISFQLFHNVKQDNCYLYLQQFMQHSWSVQRELLPVCKEQQLCWGDLGLSGKVEDKLDEYVRKTYMLF